MYIIVSQLLDEVAQSYWSIIVYCGVTISDWIMKHNNYPFISNVARYTGSSPLDVMSSVPINFDTLNCVFRNQVKSVIRSLKLTSAASICYNIK